MSKKTFCTDYKKQKFQDTLEIMDFMISNVQQRKLMTKDLDSGAVTKIGTELDVDCVGMFL